MSHGGIHPVLMAWAAISDVLSQAPHSRPQHDHAAACAATVSGGGGIRTRRNGGAHPQDEGGARRPADRKAVFEERNLHDVLQQGRVGESRLRRRSCITNLFRQARQGAQPERSGDHRRLAAGAAALQPLRQHEGGDCAAELHARSDGGRRLYLRRRRPTAEKAKPIVTRGQPLPPPSIAPYLLDSLRTQLEEQYGAKDVVRETASRFETGLDPALQRSANRALDEGLRRLDKMRGFRKPTRNILDEKRSLETFRHPRWTRDPVAGDVMPAVVIGARRRRDQGPRRAAHRHDRAQRLRVGKTTGRGSRSRRRPHRSARREGARRTAGSTRNSSSRPPSKVPWSPSTITRAKCWR